MGERFLPASEFPVTSGVASARDRRSSRTPLHNGSTTLFNPYQLGLRDNPIALLAGRLRGA